MYKIVELQEMSDDQLREVAESRGIKPEPSDREALIYAILDDQAESTAVQDTERRKNLKETQPQGEKSGRRLKESKDSNPSPKKLATLEIADDPDALFQSSETQPKKRGRKSKAQKALEAQMKEAKDANAKDRKSVV